MGEIEILEPIVVYQDKYATLYNDRVLFPSGKEGSYLRFLWNGPAGSVILPITQDGKVVLFRHFRHALREWALEIPRGHGKVGEKPEETARRELREETGLNAKKIIQLGTVTPDSGILASKVSLFLALDCQQSQEADDKDSGTIEQSILKPYEEVKRMALEGEIEDGFTILALFRAQKYLK